jgi:murein endopeptidase
LSGAVETIFLDYRVQRKLYRIAKASGASRQLLDQVFQYPRGSRSNFGIVRHSGGHEGHIHVRFACGAFEPNCGD